MNSENYIAKGIYRHEQAGNLVSVKNYIFLRKKGKKCLLLRFANELEHTVDGITYTVLQYDGEGNLLGRSDCSYGDLNFFARSTFTPQEALPVDERCADFKVVFSEVRSGNYRYCLTGDLVSVYYTGIEKTLFDDEEEILWDPDEKIAGYSAKRRSFGDEASAVLVAVMLVLILVGMNLFNMFFVYRTEMKDRKESVYSESAADGEALNLDDGEQYAEV